jgi:2'-5' RNA ligase
MKVMATWRYPVNHADAESAAVSSARSFIGFKQEKRMVIYLKLLAVLGLCVGPLPGYMEKASAESKPITAINIALDPDATMIQHAETANARLRKDYPEGFALDATHRPHVTLLQRYVFTENLDKIYTAVGQVLTHEKIADWKLKAYKYDYTPWKNMGIAIIAIEPMDDLLKLQQKLIDSVTPFTAKTGTAEAFFTTVDDPGINPTTIDYVTTFIPNQTGKNFQPHVTLGIASPDYLKAMTARPFEVFMFSPAGVSVYQLGNFGTARKQLKEWKLKP